MRLLDAFFMSIFRGAETAVWLQEMRGDDYAGKRYVAL